MKPNECHRGRRRKHLLLDQTKLERAQKLLGTQTEKEIIKRALDEVNEERERNRQTLLWRASASSKAASRFVAGTACSRLKWINRDEKLEGFRRSHHSC